MLISSIIYKYNISGVTLSFYFGLYNLFYFEKNDHQDTGSEAGKLSSGLRQCF